MAKDEEGRSVYINLWPSWIDLEEKVYKPILLGVLPFISALFVRSIGGIVTGISVVGYKIFDTFRKFWCQRSKDDWVNEIIEDLRGFLKNLETRLREITEGTRNYMDNINTSLNARVSEFTDGTRNVMDNINSRPKQIIKGVGSQFENYKIKTVLNTLGYSLQLCLAGAALVLVIVVLYLSG
jgi:hypothetical protein